MRKKALSSERINMEKDSFQRSLLLHIKRFSSNNPYSDFRSGSPTQDRRRGGSNDNISNDGYFTECKCMENATGNPYSLEGCSINDGVSSNTHGSHPYSPTFSDDLDESPSSSSSTIVIQVDPCHDTHVCGPHSLCVAHRGGAFCRCNYDAVGQPPNCKLRCGKDQHCLFNQVCLNGKCEVDKPQFISKPPSLPSDQTQFESNLIGKK